MQHQNNLAKSDKSYTSVGYRLALEAEPRRIRVEFGGRIIADSNNVLVMHEGALPPVFYFPRADVDMTHLQRTDHLSHCPFKGNASYWTLQVGERSAENAAWSYEMPYDESADVRNYIAFYWNRMDQWYANDLPILEQPSAAVPAKDNPLALWLIRHAWAAKSSEDLVKRLSEAMQDAGIPIWRLRLLVRTINPLLIALTYNWQRDNAEVIVHKVSHDVVDERQYNESPFALVIRGEGGVRRRLEGQRVRLDFPVLKDLQDEGGTDYVAMPMKFSDGQLNVITLASDQPGGFSTEQLGQIYEILPTLSRVFEAHALRISSASLLRTYLGSDAGQRVMDGLVKRGDGENIHAAIWITDLRGSTTLAETMSRDDYLALLNGYFDCVAGSVMEHGGEVLKFIGDSVLAIFAIDNPNEAQPAACAQALKAAKAARQHIAEFNAQQQAAGRHMLNFGIGLHRGDLTYGNIGTDRRLDFTVIGSAVNEAARLEGLTKELKQQILISPAFQASVAAPMTSLGKQQLRGVAEPVEVYCLSQSAC